LVGAWVGSGSGFGFGEDGWLLVSSFKTRKFHLPWAGWGSARGRMLYFAERKREEINQREREPSQSVDVDGVFGILGGGGGDWASCKPISTNNDEIDPKMTNANARKNSHACF
jgi:hypothetical protein